MTDTEYIRFCVPKAELLAGLAEEAAELAQAALKYRRALDGKNPTPIMETEAYAAMLEEVADVFLYLGVLEIAKAVDVPGPAADLIDRTLLRKTLRWRSRLDRAGE